MVVDEGCEGEIVKEIGEESPNVSVSVLAQAFVVETIDLCDLSGFVIASEDCDAIAVSEFQGDEQGDCLDGVVASVYIVAHEEVIGVWRVAANSE